MRNYVANISESRVGPPGVVRNLASSPHFRSNGKDGFEDHRQKQNQLEYGLSSEELTFQVQAHFGLLLQLRPFRRQQTQKANDS